MAGMEPPAADDAERWRGQDRDTEPMPRARVDATPDSDLPGDVDDEHGEDGYQGFIEAGSSDVVDELYDSPESVEEGSYEDGSPPDDLNFTEEEFGRLRDSPAPAAFASRRVMPLEDEPTKLIARYLFPTEKFRGEWKHHWIQIAREIAAVVLATILMGYLTGLAANNGQSGMVTLVILAWGVAMVVCAWRIADWYVDRFILTNKRVMVVKGLITRNVGMMPLLRVTDMKYVQSPLGRLLGYGTFELESAGQDQALSKVQNLPNPNELYLRIVEEMYEPEAVEARLSRGPGDTDGT